MAELIRFAVRVLRWLDWGLANDVGRDKNSWLLDLREELSGWHRKQQLVERTVREISKFGWTNYRLDSLEAIWAFGGEAEKDLIEKSCSLSRQMLAGVGSNETLPDRTEVFESAFGQNKGRTEPGPSPATSSLVLAVGPHWSRLRSPTAKSTCEKHHSQETP